MFAFAVVTLIVGGLFYERIRRHIESWCGDVPGRGACGFWRTFGKGLAGACRAQSLAVPLSCLIETPSGSVPVA